MSDRPELAGSAREPLDGARAAGDADPAAALQVSLVVRRRDAAGFAERAAQVAERAGAPLTRDEYAQRYGADPADLAAVRAFAQDHGLAVAAEDAPRRTVVLAGTVARFNQAFGIRLQRFDYPGGTYRGYRGPVRLPPALDGIVEAVLGLDDRPQARRP